MFGTSLGYHKILSRFLFQYLLTNSQRKPRFAVYGVAALKHVCCMFAHLVMLCSNCLIVHEFGNFSIKVFSSLKVF